MLDWLVVGLGNPDAEYALSPHNIGFMVIDRLAERNGARVTRNESRSLAGFCEVGGQKLMLAKPQTYMNLSGGSVKPLLDKYELEPKRLIVVYDDHDLAWQD